ncbi:hypothetical protein BC829DRAFT_382499 [Chytridium lagenaria]|nr:hypothetical protein BC829DRAFT_382499 [Chytridium lagenaria]
MSNPFELDFEFQLEQFVLRTPKPPLAKLKWRSKKPPISRPKVLTISRHHFGSPKKPPEPLLPMLPDKTKHVSHQDDSHDIDDSDLKENESHRLPPAHPTQHPTKPPPAGAEKPTILVPLNDTHPHHNPFSASYSTYGLLLHANYIPLITAKFTLKSLIASLNLKKSSQRSFSSHVNAPGWRSTVKVNRYKGSTAPKGFFDRLAELKKSEGERRKKKAHRLATPRYRVLWAKRAKPEKLHDVEEDEGEKDGDEEDEPQTETTAQPSSSSDSQAKKPLSRNASRPKGDLLKAFQCPRELAVVGVLNGAEASAQEVEDTNTKAELVDAHQSSEVADTYDGPEETHEETSSHSESSDQAPPTEPEASVEVVEETHPNVVDATHHDEGKPEEEASPVEYGEDFGEEQQHDVPALEHVEDAAIVENVEMPSGGDEASAVHEPEVNASKFATEGADEIRRTMLLKLEKLPSLIAQRRHPAAFDTANNSQESSVEDAVISSEEVPASAVDANVMLLAEYESPVVDDASPSSEHSPVETTSEELVQEIENAAVIHTEESGETVVARRKPVEDAPEENITDSPTDAADAFEESGEVPGGVDGGAAKAKEEGEVDAIAQA